MNAIRRLLYFAAKILGDVNAVRRGPHAVAKRLARRAVGRLAGKAMGRLVR